MIPITLKNSIFDFSRPYIVGILNMTTDSFSDGGEFFDFDAAKNHLLKLISDGADIVDIGAESTKPFSMPVSPDLQLEKLIPILEFIKNEDIKIPVSIDTRSSKVAQRCIEAGADIINDVSGLQFDSNMVDVVAKYNVSVIIQHSKGTPEDMQISPQYENLIDEIILDLKSKIDFAQSKGVKPQNIIIDPGIGFGKTKEHNLEIIKRVDEFTSLNYPVMLGISRKSFLGLNDASNEEKDIYTLAFNATFIDKGVNFIRVHNVKMHKNYLLLNDLI